MYKKSNIKAPLNTVGLDVTPAILVPFYDEDSSTLFVTGKGDSTIFTFDITDESPYVCPLSHHRASTSHQGLSFLMKNQCNVSIVEFAKALRLTNNTIECLSFTVPRLKSELFQDDLFPATRVAWQASMTAEEWFDVNVKDKLPMRISLQPEGMATRKWIRDGDRGEEMRFNMNFICFSVCFSSNDSGGTDCGQWWTEGRSSSSGSDGLQSVKGSFVFGLAEAEGAGHKKGAEFADGGELDEGGT